MTIPRRSWRGAGAFAAAAVVGLAGGVISAAPAAAHTPTWVVTCSDVSVDLTAYSSDVANVVTVSVVGGKELLPATTFGREFHTKTPLQLPSHDKELTVRLVVKAGDGEKFSRDETKQAPVCEDSTPSPTPTEAKPTPSTEPPATQTPEPSATPSETATETAPAPAEPSPSAPDLAETGSSSATPVIGGAAIAVLLAGGGILWSVRKRRSAQH
ncbi:LPXTG cell wall anchor domain-containing protein [Streptomyces sp. NBC_00683]|uniref:LAETG motif-containing sortase-dependent surface protein n=1 Tax=Streptomyces sp. NBC_00683 TaxID=2903670 RepID=UPI002E32CDCE|nr:LAETG motif-containing sortase-dependent surface protein [Streptomyces sp. NBC_00683]